MDNTYEMMTQLPLFQGVSKSKILELIEKTRFHFLKFKAGDRIARKGEEYTHLKFLVSGNLRLETVNRNEKIKVSEVISAPNVLTPSHIFGRNTYHPGDVFAESDVNIMQIDKITFVNIMQNESIFLINLLNIISRQSQKTLESFFSLSSGSMKGKLALWVLTCTQSDSSDIRILSKQKDLYTLFGVQRSVFVNALEELRQEGIINYTPREISFVDRDKLREVLIAEDHR